MLHEVLLAVNATACSVGMQVNVKFLEHQHTRTKERLIRSTGICRAVSQSTAKSLQVEWLRLEVGGILVEIDSSCYGALAV